MSIDPVFQDEDGKWYHWDEVWAFKLGPYDTEAEARINLLCYCEALDAEREGI